MVEVVKVVFMVQVLHQGHLAQQIQVVAVRNGNPGAGTGGSGIVMIRYKFQ